jgi:hypothetical protein
MMSKLFDPENATKAALFGGEEGWYDAFWNAGEPSSMLRRINKITGLVRVTTAAIRTLSLSLGVHAHKIGMAIVAAVGPFDYPMRSRRLQTGRK